MFFLFVCFFSFSVILNERLVYICVCSYLYAHGEVEALASGLKCLEGAKELGSNCRGAVSTAVPSDFMLVFMCLGIAAASLIIIIIIIIITATTRAA